MAYRGKPSGTVGVDAAFHGNAARKLQSSSAAVKQVPQELPRKKGRSNLVHLTEKELRKARYQGLNPLKIGMLIVCIAAAFSLVAFSVYGQVQLTELTEKINYAQTDLRQLESVQVQLEMQASSNMDVAELEAYAKNELGMEKVNRNQMTYINLATEDQGVVLVADQVGWWEKILEFFGM